MDRERSDTVQSSVVDMTNLKDDQPFFYCDKEYGKSKESLKNDASKYAFSPFYLQKGPVHQRD